jgi:predicted MFS family arabinose efflux permease
VNTLVNTPGFSVAKYRLTSLRLLVVLPGAFVKGAIGVALPWMLASTVSSGTSLGLLTSGVIALNVLGSLAGGWAASRFGERGTAIVSAALSVIALIASLPYFISGAWAAAYVGLLIVFFYDSAADVAAHSRLPVIARLTKISLTQLASGNWLWALIGAIAGGIFSGWCLETGLNKVLAYAIVIAALTTLLGHVVTLPRDQVRNFFTRRGPTFKSLLGFVMQQRELLIICGVVLGGSMLLGPADQLIVPFILNRGGYSAEFFSWVLAAGALGAAIGLLGASHLPKSERQHSHIIFAGTIGIAAYIGLWLIAPSATVILAGMILVSVLAAPMLPVLEASFLRCAASPYRSILIGLLTAAAGVADALGGLVMGAGLDLLGPSVLLMIILSLVVAGGMLTAWSYRKPKP